MESTAYDLSMAAWMPGAMSEKMPAFCNTRSVIQETETQADIPAKKKAFVNSQHQVMLTCPACTSVRVLEKSPFRPRRGMIRLKYRCKCGQETVFMVERRRRFRKAVRLPGIYATAVVERAMIVMDLSRTGLRMEVDADAQVAEGDELWVEFCLDNPSRTFIQKKCVVRNINGNTAGVRFCVRDQPGPVEKAYDRAIGYYLFEGLNLQHVKLLPL